MRRNQPAEQERSRREAGLHLREGLRVTTRLASKDTAVASAQLKANWPTEGSLVAAKATTEASMKR